MLYQSDTEMLFGQPSTEGPSPREMQEKSLEIDVDPLQIDFGSAKIDFGSLELKFQPLQIDFEPLQIDFESRGIDFEPPEIDFESPAMDLEPFQMHFEPFWERKPHRRDRTREEVTHKNNRAAQPHPEDGARSGAVGIDRAVFRSPASSGRRRRG